MIASHRIVLLFVLLSTASACGPAGPQLSETSSPIVEGTPDAAHDSVVGIIRLGTGICTGTLLTPDLVLTARHCVSELVANFASKCEDVPAGSGNTIPGVTIGDSWASQLSVFLGPTLSESDGEIEVAEAIVPPEAVEGGRWCGRDIALLRLAEPLPAAALGTPRLDVPVSADETFTAIGYGYTAAGDEHSYGVRRAHEDAAVEWIDDAHPNTFEWTLDGEWASLDAFVCNGDSGGPALDVEDRVIGVASRSGGSYCDGPGIYQGLAAYRTWLREEATKDAKRLGVAPPSWATALPTFDPLPSHAEPAPEESSPAPADAAGCSFVPAERPSFALLGAALATLLVRASRRPRVRAVMRSACAS